MVKMYVCVGEKKRKMLQYVNFYALVGQYAPELAFSIPRHARYAEHVHVSHSYT